MTAKVKAGKKGGAGKRRGEAARGGKEDLLLETPEGKFSQDKVDGSGVLKETVSKEIQEAAEYWFGKKVEEARSKANVKKAGEDLLKLMEKEEKTAIVVFNSDLQRKVRVNILQGAEKLRIEKNIND